MLWRLAAGRLSSGFEAAGGGTGASRKPAENLGGGVQHSCRIDRSGVLRKNLEEKLADGGQGVNRDPVLDAGAQGLVAHASQALEVIQNQRMS